MSKKQKVSRPETKATRRRPKPGPKRSRRLRVKWVFDSKNEAAQAQAEKSAAKLISPHGASAEARAAIRALILQSIREGIDPYALARMIRESIGMNKQQAASAAEYRGSLSNSGLPATQVERRYNRYVKVKIAERALTIARTELMDALNAGVRAAAQQAMDEGLLGKGAQKGWKLSGLGGRRASCPNCVAMSQLKIPLKAKFPYPDGRELDGPTGHPRCRCSTTIYPE